MNGGRVTGKVIADYIRVQPDFTPRGRDALKLVVGWVGGEGREDRHPGHITAVSVNDKREPPGRRTRINFSAVRRMGGIMIVFIAIIVIVIIIIKTVP